MTKTAEDYLNELPYRITRTIERKCPHCRNGIFKTQIQYELIFDLFPFEHKPNEVKFRYQLYYGASSVNLYVPVENQIIGSRAGIGHKTIKEAVKALKEHLKTEEVSK